MGLLDISGHDRVAIEFLNSFRQFLEFQFKPSVVLGASLGGLYALIALGLKMPWVTRQKDGSGPFFG